MVTSKQPQTGEALDRRPDHRHSEEYVVERFVRHGQLGLEAHYVVQRFEYIEGDDTVQPPRHILHHVIVAYWRRKQRRDRRKAKTSDNTNQPASRQLWRYERVRQQ